MSKEIPILFSAAMVRAILAGTKTQTRRIARGDIDFLGSKDEQDNPDCWGWPFDGKQGHGYAVLGRGHTWRQNHDLQSIECPYGDVGRRLWVKETFSRCALTVYPCPPCWFRADFGSYDDPARDTDHAHKGTRQADCFACVAEMEGKFVWRPSIYMPRHLSRLTLEVTSVRAERLQQILEQDAEAEGVATLDGALDEVRLCARAKVMGIPATEHRVWFAELWDEINLKRAPWSSNPWVWCVSFRVVTP